jgi:hypothetical protein
MDGIIRPEFGRKLLHVAGYPAAICAKQSGIVNPAGILLEILIDCIQLVFGGQACDEIQLAGDHSVGSRDQVVVDLPVDEAEQRDDEDRKHSGYRKGPVKSARSHELRLTHRISPPGYPAGRQ